MPAPWLDRLPALAAPALPNSLRADIVLLAVTGLVLVGLICVVWHRFRLQRLRGAAEASVTRPVLAVLLVGTVLVLAAASLTFDDAQSRNLLIGGVVSLASAAAAFYFASSNATEARRDLLAATGATVDVPDLSGKTFKEAQGLLSRVALALVPPVPMPEASATITSQDPPPGPSPRGIHAVHVFFGRPTAPPGSIATGSGSSTDSGQGEQQEPEKEGET